MLPQLYETKKITIIISPLNMLELDQVSYSLAWGCTCANLYVGYLKVRRFQELGISAAALNQDISSQGVRAQFVSLSPAH
jgi:hypothetical protein